MNAAHLTLMPPPSEPRLPPSGFPGAPQRAAATRRAITSLAHEPFGAQVELQLATCRRHGVGMGVTWIRLLGLAEIGERHGLGAQRQLVESVQQRLQGRLRHVDKVCAVALDTFGVALFDVREPVVPGIERRLHRELSSPYRIGGEIVQLQVLVGSALSPQSNHNAVELMRQAADASSVAQRA
jgi:predicted signal transduction protein with EAL and GGDEF domain